MRFLLLYSTTRTRANIHRISHHHEWNNDFMHEILITGFSLICVLSRTPTTRFLWTFLWFFQELKSISSRRHATPVAWLIFAERRSEWLVLLSTWEISFNLIEFITNNHIRFQRKKAEISDFICSQVENHPWNLNLFYTFFSACFLSIAEYFKYHVPLVACKNDEKLKSCKSILDSNPFWVDRGVDKKKFKSFWKSTEHENGYQSFKVFSLECNFVFFNDI